MVFQRCYTYYRDDTQKNGNEHMGGNWNRIIVAKRFIYKFLSVPLPPPESAGVQPTSFGQAILQPRMHSMRIN